MRHRSTTREAGFSLMEMVVAMALGTIVLGAAVQIYIQGLNATMTVSQRAELQQDFRAASNMLTKDLSLAGAGLGQGAAIQLPTSSSLPKIGCDQTNTCYINSTYETYPVQGSTPFLYGLMPGYNKGPTLLAAQGPTDVITVAYTDSTFYLDCYNASVASATSVTFILPSSTSTNCTAPGTTTPQNVNDGAVGLSAGDLIWFSFQNGSQVVAEVTGAVTSTTTGGVTTYTVPFAATDPLNMNQPSTSPKSLSTVATGTAGYANRLQVVTYYLDNSVSPARLMRQVSGHSPIPVAENTVFMKFSYNLFNTNTTTVAIGCTNPGASSDGCSGASAGMLPNQVTQINIANMAMDSSLQSSQYGQGNGYQRMDLQTSVSARNLTYVNNFSN